MWHACVGEGSEGSMYRVWVGKPGGKRPPARPIHRWAGTTKMSHKVVGRTVWTGLMWLVRTRKEPSGCVKCGEFLDSRRNCQLIKGGFLLCGVGVMAETCCIARGVEWGGRVVCRGRT
jgi:hypothetical protein